MHVSDRVRSDCLPLSLTHSTGVTPLGTKGPWVFCGGVDAEREREREQRGKVRNTTAGCAAYYFGGWVRTKPKPPC